jgi:hypothetical protein
MGRDGFGGLVGVAVILACLGSTIASEVGLAMDIRQSTNGSEIHLSGKVEIGDFEKFEAVAATADNAIVSLASPGGLLDEGLRIGARIRERGFSTAVPDGAVCASACGLIWLAGTSRFVEGNGRVGFHAIYVADDDHSISAPGNALVGSYMARLGYSDLAVAYATEAGPSDMRWLTPSNASFLGIAVTWNNVLEKTAPSLSTILSRAQIEDALLRRRSAQLLRAKLPGSYSRMIDGIVAAQAEGLSWTSSLMWVLNVGFPEDMPDKIDDFGKLTIAVAAKLYASEWVGLNLLHPLSLLQKENPTLCAEWKVQNSLEALYRGSSPETEKWRSEIVRMQFDIIEIALSDDPPELRVLSAAENKLLEIWPRTQWEAFVRTLSKREINFLQSNKMGPRVSCRYNIFFLTQLRDNRKMANIFLRSFVFDAKNPPATAKRHPSCRSFGVPGRPANCPPGTIRPPNKNFGP